VIREWLEARRNNEYKRASMENLGRFDRDLTALGDMFARDVIAEGEYNKRLKVLQKQSEQDAAVLRSVLERKPRIIDVPALRITVEALAWSILFVFAAFLVHPVWTDDNVVETFLLGCIAGFAAAYLRNTWKRGNQSRDI
jgi:hypothetical protein